MDRRLAVSPLASSLAVLAVLTMAMLFVSRADAGVRIVAPSEALASQPVRFAAVPGAKTEQVSFYVDGRRRWVDHRPSWKFGHSGRVALGPGHHVLTVKAQHPNGTVTSSKSVEVLPPTEAAPAAPVATPDEASSTDEAETAPTPAEAVAASSEGVLEAGFEDGLANWNICGLGETLPTISSDARSGAASGDFRLTGHQERSELILGGNGGDDLDGMVHFRSGDEYWYGFSFNVQQMVWGHPGAHNLIMQLKSDGTGSPEFGLQLWNYAGDDGHSGGKGLWSHSNPDSKAPGGDRFLAPVSEDAWHDVAIHFKASEDHEGFYEIFLDGKLVEARSNQTMIVPGREFAYIKDGLYRNGETIPGTSEVLIDSARLGTSQAAVAPR